MKLFRINTQHIQLTITVKSIELIIHITILYIYYIYSLFIIFEQLLY